MQKLTKKENMVQSLKFTLFSLGAGVIQITSTLLFEHVFKLEAHIAYLIGLVLSVLFNFTVNRRYTFKSANNVPAAMAKVALFYAAFTPLTTWLDKVLTQDYGWDSTLVLIGIMLLNFITEFLYCRFFVYRGSINTNGLAHKKES
jgi:Predicted membrane protein